MDRERGERGEPGERGERDKPGEKAEQGERQGEVARAVLKSAIAVALVSGGLAAFVAVKLAARPAGTGQIIASGWPRTAGLRQQLASRTGNAEIRSQYRELDLKARREYFARMRFAAIGGYLLAGLVGLCLAAAGVASALAWRVKPATDPPADERSEQTRSRRQARWAVELAASLGAAAAIVAAVMYRPAPLGPPAPTRAIGPIGPIGKAARQAVAPPAAVPAYPSAEQIAANWPRFRGPGGAGVSTHTNVPTHWTGRPSSGVAWRSAVPLPGENSPVVWAGRVFVTGADRTRREVYCYNADDGTLLWRAPVDNVPGKAVDPPNVTAQTGYAAPTVATDGRRVYAIFANGDLAAFGFDGKRLWARNLSIPVSPYGYASSLATYRGLVLVQYDQGDEQDGLSEMLAFDAATGKTAWRTPRPVAASWATPIVADTPAGPQIITCARPWVIAYDPADGKEIWRTRCLDGDVAPSPIYAGGLVFAVEPDVTVYAIRPPDRPGAQTGRIVWQADDGAPDITSPASDGKTLLLLTTQGLLTCYDAGGGTKLYEHQFDGTFCSSPTFAGERVYLMDDRGKTYIIAAGRSFKLLATATLGEKSNCSPAFADGRIYIRGEKNLYCITGQGE